MSFPTPSPNLFFFKCTISEFLLYPQTSYISSVPDSQLPLSLKKEKQSKKKVPNSLSYLPTSIHAPSVCSLFLEQYRLLSKASPWTYALHFIPCLFKDTIQQCPLLLLRYHLLPLSWVHQHINKLIILPLLKNKIILLLPNFFIQVLPRYLFYPF